MRKTYILVLLLLLLGGCSSDKTAKRVIDAIENEEFYTAKQIYQDAIDESDAPLEIEESVAEAVHGYINDSYDEVEADSGKESAFYYLLTNVENIGIEDYDLEDTIKYYKGIIEDSDSYVEGDTNIEDSNEEVSYEEDNYIEEDIDEEVIQDNPYTATDIDHNCTDFDSQEDAQLFFEANGGPEYDPHDLDRDGDGIACEWN
ncbi:excalibur calcium-binding domain-containing protein [Neobacillus mesonae]|uniref:excalibur calcium-binding domain-containing protein n=1 Tax=Neobacillus mesonae TaxID=1193713 RepID=UPI00082A652C